MTEEVATYNINPNAVFTPPGGKLREDTLWPVIRSGREGGRIKFARRAWLRSRCEGLNEAGSSPHTKQAGKKSSPNTLPRVKEN